MISQATIEKVKSVACIEEVVGEFITLKQRGENLISCCPFHAEEVPSFLVTPSKGIFYCTSCHRGGDSIRFVMEHEKCSQDEAIRWLAKKYNVYIEDSEDSISSQEEMFRVSEFAQNFFVDYLWNDEMGQAVGLSYYRQRGLTDEIVKHFGLGYSPDQWTALTDAAKQKGFSDASLSATGLTIVKEDGRYADRFKGRVTFPIYNITGRVVGFSCRVLSKEQSPAKYVNSIECPIYTKGNILYGIYQAKEKIREENKCYLVEGNLDVVSMHQSGVENTVASCGTALTANQVRLISQFANNITIVYDGDDAGIKATLKAANLCFEAGLKVRMVLFPDSEDPDSYAKKYGAEQLRQYLSEYEENYVAYRAKILSKAIKNDPIRKTEAVKEIVRTIALVKDKLEREEYIRQCSFLLQEEEKSLNDELLKAMQAKAKKAMEQASIQGTSTMSQSTVAANLNPNLPPDDLFLPDEFKTPAVSVPQTQQPKPAIAPAQGYFPDEEQEKKIISLLLNSGHKTIPFIEEDEMGEKREVSYAVAYIIVDELSDISHSFYRPVYQVIFEEYASALEHDEILDASYFIEYKDQELSTTAISLMINHLHVSPKWKEHHVPVLDPETRLKEDVLYSLLTFKLKKLDHRLEEVSRKLRRPANEEEMLQLVAEKSGLLKYRQDLTKELNCVYH